MAKQAKAAAAKKETGNGKLGGCLLPNTSIGHIFTALKDGKWHKISNLKSCLTAKGVNLPNRLRRLHRKGLRTKQWRLQQEGDNQTGQVRLVMGKPPADAAMREKAEKEAPARKPATKKPAAKASKSKPVAPATKRTSVEDVPVSDD